MKGPKQRLGAPYRMVAGTVVPLMHLVTHSEYQGAEHLPPEGKGAVICANHLSMIDFITFGGFIYENGRAVRFMAKAGLFEAPVIGAIAKSAKQIPVYRQVAGGGDALRAAIDAVRAGEVVGIMPEGTLTRDPDTWPMRGKSGAARIALATGAPLIPVAQWGPNLLLPPYSRKPDVLPLKKVTVHMGAPLDIDDLRERPDDPAAASEATERLMRRIADMLGEIRGKQPPAVLFDPEAAGVAATGNPNRPKPGRKSSK